MSETAIGTPAIHRTAEVGPDVVLGEGVQIGPRCVLEGSVRLGDGVRLIGDVYILGPADIGDRTIIYPFATLGFPGQDRKFAPGDPTAGVRVGCDCVLRESFTMHAATNEHTPTSLGDRCMCMVGSHLGHDCTVGNDVTMVNGCSLGGHVRVDDRANLSGGAMVHQFGRVGTLAMVTGVIAISADVPPYCLVGERNRVSGLNRIGMRRAGMSREEINRIQLAFRTIYTRHMQRGEVLETLAAMSTGSPGVAELSRWFSESKRPFCAGPSRLPRWFTYWLRSQRDSADAVVFEDDEMDADT